MKNNVSCCILLWLLPLFLLAQNSADNKRDYVWMFGYENYPPNFGGSCLNFNQIPPASTYVPQEIYMSFTNASICDSNGNLLFYTNGMYVADANHQIMPNGDSLNPGDLFNYFDYYGYSLIQGALTLPLPGSDSLFIIIHEKLIWDNEYVDLAKGLYYTMVDMTLNNGLGDVTEKNILINNDSLDPGLITATRHANGRDWWILIPEFIHNRYYRYLVCPQGIVLKGEQNIGEPSSMMELGQACFSPDGNKYVRFGSTAVNLPFRLEVFDFNRCTGLLSNYRNLWYVDDAYANGVAISPNSRYMYVSAQTVIDQYDLMAEDIAASKITVAEYDGFVDPQFWLGRTYFFMAQLAPDGKIYLCTMNGTHYLHVINQPDLPGLSCDITQHSQYLNTFNASSLPSFPNFRLGPLPCSDCDTLGLSGTVISGKLTYGTSTGAALDSCHLYLHASDGSIMDSCMSDADGNYRFCGISPGMYYISAGTNKPWGGSNTVDALLAMKYFGEMISLSGIIKDAADVNIDVVINAIDALLIQKRFVGLSNAFPAGDWLFEQPQFTVTGTSNLNIDIIGICAGDINISY